ncbi:microcystin dependent MdpB family protein [Duganella caerulea]|uniref:phage tail protein n=1 Tax=Duganella caerulea TaxID=2885762 RepID=UPI0030EA30DC
MKPHIHRIAMAAIVAAGSWSNASLACSTEDYLSTICVLAAPSNNWRNYTPADGRLMPIAQNSALYALIGTTYGGDGQSTFGLPDLRGRFLLGAGNSPTSGNFIVGQVGGTTATTLTINNLPSHVHSLAVPLTLTGLTGNANLGAVTGGTSSVSLAGVTYTADATQLRIQAVNAPAGTASPSGAYLAESAGPANRVYTSGSPPTVAMAAGAITGTVTVKASGTGTVTLAGTAPVTVGGTTNASGNTGIAGASQPLSIMPPYIAMYYMIATVGIFPSRN